VSKTTFQHGMAALIGLVMAASGCPRTRFLRPMARTHLPFATDQETVFRTLAVHLLGQYVAAGTGAPMALSFADLKHDYQQLSKVNSAMSERIRAAITRDAAVNAVIILESFTMIAPENIDYGFEDIQDLFVVEED
jgi:ATP-dependent protease ClpP protease subunit